MVSVKGVVFLSLLTGTAITGSLLLTPLSSLLLILGRLSGSKTNVFFRAAHAWSNILSGSWFFMCSSLLEGLLGVRVSAKVLSTKSEDLECLLRRPSPGKFSIIICNHRTRIDWMLLWVLFARTNILMSLRIVLKGSLAQVPFFGWAMQSFRFLFLTRKWDVDKHHIENVCSYMKRHNDGGAILIFPEGTDLSESNVEKSHKYAEANGLTKFRYVLNPRSTGLIAIKNFLGVENIESIVDITMGYTDSPGEGRPSEKSLLNGCPASQIHFLCRQIEIQDIPQNDDEFKLWIEARFAEKESLLSSFYSCSPNSFERAGITNAVSSKVVVKDMSTSLVKTLMQSWKLSVAVLCIWWVPSLLLGYALLVKHSLVAWLYVSTLSVSYFFVTKIFGGVDRCLQY